MPENHHITIPPPDNNTMTIPKSLVVTIIIAIVGCTYMFGAWNNTTVTDHKTLMEVQKSIVDLRLEVQQVHLLLENEIEARKKSEASVILAPRLYNGK